MPASPGDEFELDIIRRLLDALIERRAEWKPEEQRRYEDLSARERELLGLDPFPSATRPP